MIQHSFQLPGISKLDAENYAASLAEEITRFLTPHEASAKEIEDEGWRDGEIVPSRPILAADLYAQMNTLCDVLQSAMKQCAPSVIEALTDDENINMPTGQNFIIGNHVLCISDRVTYNYGSYSNDNNGAYRSVLHEIDRNNEEGKVLTKEKAAIEARILYEHPNMVPQHKYILMYKGLADDVYAGKVITDIPQWGND